MITFTSVADSSFHVNLPAHQNASSPDSKIIAGRNKQAIGKQKIRQTEWQISGKGVAITES